MTFFIRINFLFSFISGISYINNFGNYTDSNFLWCFCSELNADWHINFIKFFFSKYFFFNKSFLQ